MSQLRDRVSGGFWGLLVGDALGVPYEFHSSKSIPTFNQIEMEVPAGYKRAHLGILPGTWSDDGAQALCLLDSLLENDRLDLNHFARNLASWYRHGTWAVENHVFDVGIQTSESIEAFLEGMTPEHAGFVRPDGKGNGSLMRVLPLALWNTGSNEQLVEDAHRQSLITHGNLTNQVCCALYCLWAKALLIGHGAEEAYKAAVLTLRRIYASSAEYMDELEFTIRPDKKPITDGSGYVVSTLNCARLAMRETSYERAVKAAIAFGGDTDTNAAIVGGLAGILYGIADIPARWLSVLRGYEMANGVLYRLTNTLEEKWNNWDIRTIPSSDLMPLDIPQCPSSQCNDWDDWNPIWRFALSFHGYDILEFDGCAELSRITTESYARSDVFPKQLSLDDLRIVLFFQQRIWRWNNSNLDENEQHFVRALVRELYSRVLEGLDNPVHRDQEQKIGLGNEGEALDTAIQELDEIMFDADENVADIADTSWKIGSRRIHADKSDPTIEVLYSRYKSGDLVLQPDFQRQFVWDFKKASRLIESILLDIPLPIVYLAEEEDGTESVIDGQQRLTSCFKFIDGDFKLSGLNVHDSLNNRLFNELDKLLQKKLMQFSIRTITFQSNSDSNFKFEIFERLNTGSVPLNDQELRNCVFRGPYIDFLKTLANDKEFRFILGINNLEKRMRDVELVLRFAAFYHSTYLKYQSPMKKFLNQDCATYRNISKEDKDVLQKAFKNAVGIINSLFGEKAFRRYYRGDLKQPNGSWESKQFNSSLYDILMYTFAKEDKNQVMQHIDEIREALIHLMSEDTEFINSILLATSSVQAVTKRFDIWRLTVQEIIGVGQREPRCFSMALKKEMFKKDPTCSICGNQIAHVDDAALDHIHQYWKGGKTVPENARLTHRYCNWVRLRSD